MFDSKRFLMIPGPTPVPEEALLTLAKSPIPHRSPEFSRVLMECTEGLKEVARSQTATPFIYAASGTGGMEAILANVMNRGMRILSVVNGVFGKRWADMAEGFGGEVRRLQPPLGQAVSLGELRKHLEEFNPEMVLVTFSETSTGVLNPLQDIAAAVREHGALLAVDAITGLGASPLEMDEWGIDVLVSGSQKGFMIPPGLAFVWVGPRAWQAHENSDFPRFYWDWTKSQKALDSETTAFTPNVSLVCALRETLAMIRETGMPAIWDRHLRLRQAVRESVRDMGLSLLVPRDEEASTAITPILPPDGVSVKDIRRLLQEYCQLIVANGQADLKDKIFRIGHLGFVSERDVATGLGSLDSVLRELGYDPGGSWSEVCRQALKGQR